MQATTTEIKPVSQPFYYQQFPKKIIPIAIIGSGMAGIAVAHELKNRRISQFHIFESKNDGLEGPWPNARMKTLRSGKDLTGPALLDNALSFKSWFLKTYSEEKWNSIIKASVTDWMDYLKWLKLELQLPISYNYRLENIEVKEEFTKLTFYDENLNEPKFIKVERVILATGRDGFGGLEIPSFLQNIPKTLWSHSQQTIDVDNLKGKKVAILGCGASAFDAAATLLEKNVGEIHFIIRRGELPTKNRFVFFYKAEVLENYNHFSDEEKIELISKAKKSGIPPPPESIERISQFSNVYFHYNRSIEICTNNDKTVSLTYSDNTHAEFDFVVAATGFAIEISNQPELKSIWDKVKLWKHIYPDQANSPIGNYPYLDKTFHLQSNDKSVSLSSIYLFNIAVILSHGLVAADIPGIHVGAKKIVDQISYEKFKNEKSINILEFNNNQKDIDLTNYPILKHEYVSL